MSDRISAQLRQLVYDRAGGRCEYCLLLEDFSPYTHEIDHIVARKHSGQTIVENLALACLPCNRRKGSDITTLDPMTAVFVPLFNPRVQIWTDHFALRQARINGLTATGRGTVFLLGLNAPERLMKREALLTAGLYPNL